MGNRLKKNLPVLRFPEFKGNWKQNNLKEVTKKIGSGATPTGGDSNYKKSGISLFRSLNVYDGFFKIENLAFIDEDQAKKLDNVTVKKGDILLNITGASIARCCIAPVELLPARVNQHVMIIRPDSKNITTEFLSFVLICNTYKKELFQLGGKGGSTREALTKKHIENFELFSPPIAEQEKIASFLGAVDTRLSQLRRKHELLQTYKRGVMQKIFSQQIRFKGDQGNSLPDWEQTTLGKCSIFFDSKRVPLSSEERQHRQGIYPYYGASGIIDTIDDYIFDGSYILLAEDGANILSRSTPVAFIAEGKFWVNNHAHILKAKGSNKFLMEYLEHLKYDHYNTGTTQPKLNAEICKKIKIKMPFLEEQEKIANFLTAIDKKIEAITKQIELTEQFKKGLLQKMFV
jgi:type I restriction enzyme S subunit